jgi:hypothetical protein
MKYDLPVVKLNKLTLINVKELEKIYNEEEIAKILEETPVIKKFDSLYVRAAEIEDLSHLANDEDTSKYDLFDLYYQSSNHILATITILKLIGKDLKDLSKSSQEVVNKIYLDNEEELKRLRKNVIELLLESNGKESKF